MLSAYQTLLRDFAHHVGLDPAELAQTQEVVMGGVAIGLACEGDEDSGDLLYFADLGAPVPRRSAAVYKALLEANHFWVGTSGATLGLQPGTGRVVCCGSIALPGLTANGLAQVLDSLIDTLLFWKQYLDDSLPEAGPPLSDPMLLAA